MEESVSRRRPGAGATRALGFEDRRSGLDRRNDRLELSDDISKRRRQRDRRESPGGHIRNVLQVLAAVEHLELSDGDRLSVEGVRRALWLALAEVERLNAQAS